MGKASENRKTDGACIRQWKYMKSTGVGSVSVLNVVIREILKGGKTLKRQENYLKHQNKYKGLKAGKGLICSEKSKEAI